MADALGIIGVIGVAGQILQLTVKLGLDWKDAPDDATSFIREVQALKMALSETYGNILVDEDFKAAFEGRRSTLLTELGDSTNVTPTSSLIDACKLQLEEILSDLTKRTKGHRLGWERLRGAFTAKKTRETIEDLQRRCRTLNCLISLDALSLGIQTHKEIKEARQEQKLWQDQQLSREILDWLSDADYDAQQSDLLRRRQAGTGQWLMDSKEYQQWVATPQTTLFCPGIPGAGKTVLTSIVIDDLQNRFLDDESVSIAYLYCNFRRQTEQTVENLLSSILLQLAQAQSSLPECVQRLYELHKKRRVRTRPSLEQLFKTLRELVNSLPRTYLVVDALDECKMLDGSRARFLDLIFALQSGSKANIFATSRFIIGVLDRFSEATSLEIRAHEEDVRRFLTGSISQLPACVAKNPTLQEEIIAKIIQAVDGMFLLAQLYFDSLKGKRSAKVIRSTLAALHTGSGAYDKAYSDAMERIEGQTQDQKELARLVLMWIACAMRPLTTFELREALAVELGETKIDPDNVPEIEDIVSVCAGLVTVDKESNIIRLVHHTTQEYFSRTSTRWFPEAHRSITEVCVTYLSFDMFRDHPLFSDGSWHERLKPDMILHYAFEFWAEHASMPESEPCNQLVSEFFLLRYSNEYLGDSVVEVIQERLDHRRYSLCLAVGENELAVASFGGKTQQVQYLLQRGARPNICGKQGRTPLSCAAKKGYTNIVKLLLDWRGIDVNARDIDGETPLYAAFEGGYYEIIDMLLKTEGIEMNAVAKFGKTLLQKAAFHGLEETARLLVQFDGNSVKARSENGYTPLHYAASQGHEGVARVLLESKGIEVNATSVLGRLTPLSLAATHGHKSVVQLFLNVEGIDVKLGEPDGSTPFYFYHAAVECDIGILQLLLDSGKININEKNRSGKTPIMFAVSSGYEGLVRFLLGVEGIDISQTFRGAQTLLHQASKKGHLGTVKALAATGQFDLNKVDSKGRTPLWLAAYNGKQETVEFLLSVEEVGMGLGLEDVNGRTALAAATKKGHAKIGELLQEAFDMYERSQKKTTGLP